MSANANYPSTEFLRDFRDWQLAIRRERDIYARAKLVFTVRYYQDKSTYIYRVNRFICVLRVVHRRLPELVQDRIAKHGSSGMDYIPEELLLALLEWYCAVPETDMDAMPDPDWNTVLENYDEKWRQNDGK